MASHVKLTFNLEAETALSLLKFIAQSADVIATPKGKISAEQSRRILYQVEDQFPTLGAELLYNDMIDTALKEMGEINNTIKDTKKRLADN